MRSVVRSTSSSPVGTVLVGLCVLYTGAYFMFYIIFKDSAEIAEASLEGYLEVMLLAVPAVVLFGAAIAFYDMDTGEVPARPVVRWAVGLGVLFVLAMHTAVFVVEAAFDPGERWLVLLLSAGSGLSVGSVVGLVQLRALVHERERNRYFAEKRRKERERKQLEYLNQALRHEVLNEAQKIDGYTSLLRDRVQDDTEAAKWLDIVAASNDDIAEFVQSIRRIMDIADHEPDLTPVDVVSVVGTEAALVDQDDGSSVTVDGPESAYALAGELIDRVFRNLFENAVQHTDGQVHIGVSIEAGEEWVRIRVRDDGNGIPPSERATLFEPPESGDHGYGLYLVRNIVEMYGGAIELVETGPRGTVFLVRLPAVSSPETYTPASMPVAPTRSA